MLTPNIVETLTPEQASEILRARRHPVFLVRLRDGRICAANRLAALLLLPAGEPAHILLGCNIIEFCTNAIRDRRLPLADNRVLIDRLAALLTVLDSDRQHPLHQAFAEAVAAALADDQYVSETPSLSAVAERTLFLFLWPPDVVEGGESLKFAITEAHVPGEDEGLLFSLRPVDRAAQRYISDAHNLLAERFPGDADLLQLGAKTSRDHKQEAPSQYGIWAAKLSRFLAQSSPVSETSSSLEPLDWRPSEPFHPELVSAILEQSAEPIENHPAFGDGFVWNVPMGQTNSISLALFPERRWASVQFVDSARRPQLRELVLDHVTILSDDGRLALSLIAIGEGCATVLNVYRTGEIDEYFRLLASSSQTLIPEAVSARPPSTARLVSLRPSPPPQSVSCVAEQLGYSRTHIKNLIKCGRLVGYKLGRNWFVDPESVDAFARRASGTQ